MCRTFPTCEPVDVVLQRLASEIASAADDLQALEGEIAKLVAAAPADGFERLQSLDRLSQQLRTLEAFLGAARPCTCGRVDIETALDRVWLEAVRKRLGGGRAHVAAPVEPELW